MAAAERMLDLGKNMIRLWWWGYRGPGTRGNYGDMLSAAMFQHWGIQFEYSDDFNTISIGSIAKVARAGTRVLGSGIMSQKDGCDPAADWQWVRGPVTRTKVLQQGGTCPEVYGDPALLLPLMVPESPKLYDLGIVPHIRQIDLAREMFPSHRIIDLRTDDAFRTAREITQCRSILSSSLHGIITAHAYGIPVAHIDLGIHIKGDGSKFQDHYQALGLDHTVSDIRDPVFTRGEICLDPLITILDDLKS